jgi:heterocyst specific transport system permease protein
MRGIPLAWLQLTFEKRRFVAALAGITFAVVLMLMQLGLREVLYRAASRIPEHVAGELVMLSPQYESLNAIRSFSERRLYSALSSPDVQTVVPVYLQMGAWKDPATRSEHRIAVIGAPPTKDALELPELSVERVKLEVPDSVLFDSGSRPEYGDLAKLYAERPNVAAEVNGRRVRVAGLFDLGASFGAGGHLLTSDVTFSRLFDRPLGTIDIGVIRLRPNVDPHTAERDIASRIPADVVVMTRDEFARLEADYWEKRAAIGFIFDLGAVMGLFVGAVIVYQILYTDVVDHLEEYATLKAIGYRDRFLFSVVLQESIVLSVLGFIPGYALAELLYLVARRNAHVPIEMTIVRAAGVFGLTVFMCVASGSIAMRKLTSADPAEIF